MDRKRSKMDIPSYVPEKPLRTSFATESEPISNIGHFTIVPIYSYNQDGSTIYSENVPRIKSKLDENVTLNSGGSPNSTVNNNIRDTRIREPEVIMIKSEFDEDVINNDFNYQMKKYNNVPTSGENSNICRSSDYTSDSQSSDGHRDYSEKVISDITYLTSESIPNIQLRSDLIKWAVKYKISRAALISLLKILREHCFSTSSSHAKPSSKTPQKQEIASGTHHCDQECNKTLVNIKDIHYKNHDNNESPTSSSNLYKTTDPQCSKNSANIKEADSNNELISRVPFTMLDFEQKSDNFQRFVTQKLISLETHINRFESNVSAYQKAIFKKYAVSNSEIRNIELEDDINVFENLPLKNEEDLNVLEAILKEDSRYRSQMITQLARITNKSLNTSCLRIMRAVLSNELAVKYSWCGARGRKQVFSQLELCKLIMSAIHHTRLHRDATNDEIAAPIKIWLSSAKMRVEKENQKQMEDTY